MKSLLLVFLVFSVSIYSQDEKFNLESVPDTIFFKKGDYKLINDLSEEEYNKIANEIMLCKDKKGNCKYEGKYIERVVIKTKFDYSEKTKKKLKKRAKIGGHYTPETLIYVPLDLTKVLKFPLKNGFLWRIPQLMYKGENYDFYEVPYQANGIGFGLVCMTKPGSKDIVNMIMASPEFGIFNFSYKGILTVANKKKHYNKCEHIKGALKRKDYLYKNVDNFHPYEIFDKCGKLNTSS